MRRRGTPRARTRGQALVEFALILPIFILLLVGLFDVGRAVFAYNTVSNAAREAARVAIVNQTESDVDAKAVQRAVSLGLTASDVTVAYSLPSGTACTSPFEINCLASVTVNYTYTAATPIISNLIGPITIRGTTTMPVERTCPDPAAGLNSC
jgi:Flp pilus assembly protein TadG